MSDTIRRDAAIEAICSVCQIEHSASCKYKEGKYGGCEEIEAIKSIPAADVQEVKHGKWKDITEYAVIPSGKCSVCGKYNRITNYCPNCGAKMEDNP